MISFDAYFSAIIALIIAYASIYITVLIESKKDNKLPARRIKISATIVMTILFAVSTCLYFWDEAHQIWISVTQIIEICVQEVLPDFIRSALPFFQKGFLQDGFDIVYAVGIASFLLIWVIVMLAMLKDAWILVLVALVLAYPILWGEYLISLLIYRLCANSSYIVPSIVNGLVNFAISLVLFFKTGNSGSNNTPTK